MAHTAVTASLIPGSLILETDRDRRILYLHVIGVRSARDVERQRQGVQRWERRIVLAVGSRSQVRRIRDAGASGSPLRTQLGGPS
jgi:multicomponent Na+:H+ antiporter subunit E